MRRLGTDRIDLYQLHHPDQYASVEETLATLDTLIKQGKVRYIGVCNHYAWQMAHMLGVSALHNWEPIVSIQCHYNIFNQSMESETSHFCKHFNIAAITYGPLSGGVLSGIVKRGQPLPENSRVGKSGLSNIVKLGPKQTEDDIYDVLDELERIAAKYNLAINQLAVKWVLSKHWITCPILGGSRAEHFSCMYNLFETEIDPEDLKRIDEISEPFRYVPFGNQPVVEGPGEQRDWW